MFTGTVFASFVALLCSSFGPVDARIVQRDVVSPPITSPTAGTVWNVNERHNVTWDTSVIPPGTTSNGMIVLGFLDPADGTNEHLDLNHPLATGFPITAGHAEITVPSVATRDTYILVLFGDSGNASGKFTIRNISISAPPSSNSIAASVSTAASTPSASSAEPATAAGSASDAGSSLTAASSPQSGVGSGAATGTATGTAAAAQLTPTAPASSVSSAAVSSAATSTGKAAAASATTSSNAGLRIASHGGVATWISTLCSLAIVLGFAL